MGVGTSWGWSWEIAPLVLSKETRAADLPNPPYKLAVSSEKAKNGASTQFALFQV